jgi:hypothetical protein
VSAFGSALLADDGHGQPINCSGQTKNAVHGLRFAKERIRIKL